MAINNKQVVAIFIIGIVLLLGAFWAGLYVVKQDTGSNAGQTAAGSQNPQSDRKANSNSQARDQQTSPDARYVVQVGASYGTAALANQAVAELRDKYKSAYVQNPIGGDSLYRVRIGPYNTREDAQQVAND